MTAATIETLTAPRVSAIVSTYSERRWDDLVAGLGSLQAQSRKPDEVIVVVDHNPELLERVRAAYPDVVAIPNAHAQGLSGSRNTGAEAAGHPILAFLDDDARADAACLERLVGTVAETETLGAGGLIQPDWDGGRPGWFPPEFDWVVGCTYVGAPADRSPVRNLIGACMAIRRDVVLALGGFNHELGRSGGANDGSADFAGTEETEMCILGSEQWPGARWIFEPAARVQHRVPASRARFYFLRRCRGEGLAKAAMAQTVPKGAALESERRYVLAALPRGIARALVDAVRHRRPGRAAAAVMICAGLLATAIGYGQGRAHFLLRRK